MAVAPLAGFTVGITAARRRVELGTALERHGARIVYGPAMRLVPVTDDSELRAATARVLAAPPDLAIATTGVGFRGWLEAADSWGLGEALLSTLAASTIVARGPKACGAVRSVGLREAWSPASESSAEVLERVLAQHEPAGRRVAVQLHGEPLRDLLDGLRAAGAQVIEVPVHRWLPPQDEAPLRRLIELCAGGSVDALAFTSAPAAVNFLRTCAQLSHEVHSVVHPRMVCAAVGPVTANPLRQAGVDVLSPERFRLGALARTITERLPSRAVTLDAAGHRLQVRGHAVVLDDQLIALPAAGMSVLRELAAHGGRVLSRRALLALLPGDSSDGHAVETAIARLRSALGDPAIIQTVVKRGYRLRVDAA